MAKKTYAELADASRLKSAAPNMLRALEGIDGCTAGCATSGLCPEHKQQLHKALKLARPMQD